jgi:hypothetical protein
MYITYRQEYLRRRIEIYVSVDFITKKSFHINEYNMLWEKYHTILQSPDNATLIIR